jgi:hypothetical protein
VNYSTLTDGASCESSQPVRETLVLRSAVCRRSSLWGWPVHLAFCDRKPRFPPSHDTDSSNAIILLPSRLPARVSNCTNTSSTGAPLLSSYQESCIPAFLPIFITTFLCKKLYKASGFHPPPFGRGLPSA